MADGYVGNSNTNVSQHPHQNLTPPQLVDPAT
jgi:hypothetical protein